MDHPRPIYYQIVEVTVLFRINVCTSVCVPNGHVNFDLGGPLAHEMKLVKFMFRVGTFCSLCLILNYKRVTK